MQLDSQRFRKHKYYLAKQILENNFSRNQSESNNNIFTSPQSVMLQKLDPSKGPKYEKKRIIKHTFVGKEEWLKNYVNNQRSKRNIELFRKAVRKIIMKNQVVNSFKNVLRKDTSKIIAPKEKERKEQKQNLNMRNIITKNEIEMYYNEAQERIKTNREQEQKNLRNMDFEIRQYLMRDLKVLENHDKMEKKWQLFESKSCKMLNRNKSQLDDVYAYRVKREQQLNMDNLHSHFDNRKTKFRLIHQEPQIPLMFSQVRERNVDGKALTEPQLQNLEMIRKPRVPVRGYSSFKSQKAFELQLGKMRSEISEDNSILEELEVSKDDLVVEGRSQLDLESSMLNGEGYFTGILRRDEKAGAKEEVMAESYDWRHFYSK